MPIVWIVLALTISWLIGWLIVTNDTANFYADEDEIDNAETD